MAQNHDYSEIDFDNDEIGDILQKISDNWIAFLTCHSGSTPPSGVNQGAYWLDTSNTPYELKQLNSDDSWVSVQKLTSLGRDILNNLLTEQGSMDDLWTTEHNRDGTHKNPISADIDQFKSVTWTTNSVSAVDTYTIAGDQTSTLLPDGDKGRMVRLAQPSQTVISPVENATYDSNNDETTVTLHSNRTADLDTNETIDDHEFGVVGPSNVDGQPLINTNKILENAVTTNEANFTDQQLSSTSSVDFSNIEVSGSGDVTVSIESTDTNGNKWLLTSSSGGQYTVRKSGTGGAEFGFQNNTSDHKNARFDVGDEIFLDANGGTPQLSLGTDTPDGAFDLNGGGIFNAERIQFSDADGDGNQTEFLEDAGNGRLLVQHAGSTEYQFDFSSGFLSTVGNNLALFGGEVNQAAHVKFNEQAGDPTTETDRAHVYAKNGTNGTEIFVQDEAGNVTEISSHDTEGRYAVFHKDGINDRNVEIHVEKMAKFIDEKHGTEFYEELQEAV